MCANLWDLKVLTYIIFGIFIHDNRNQQNTILFPQWCFYLKKNILFPCPEIVKHTYQIFHLTTLVYF